MAVDTAEIADRLRVGFGARKIARRSDGSLIAASGDASLTVRALEAFCAGLDLDLSDIKEDASFEAIVADINGEAFAVDRYGRSLITGEFYAAGSAFQFLMGAMAAGASAETAVALAIKYDGFCGGEVQVERVGEAPQ